jgi:hypothetical protein
LRKRVSRELKPETRNHVSILLAGFRCQVSV